MSNREGDSQGTKGELLSTAMRLRVLINEVRYKDWRFLVDERPSSLTVRPVFEMPVFGDGPGMTPGVAQQAGRPWLITDRMTDSEIVQTLFLAIMVAEEHEIREGFTYRGRRIFSPHFHIDALAGLDHEGGART